MGRRDRDDAKIAHRGLAQVNADTKIVRSTVANSLPVPKRDFPISVMRSEANSVVAIDPSEAGVRRRGGRMTR